MTGDGKLPQAKWYHNALVVLFLIFFVLGPFGLPILWKSPHFSKTWKWIFTVLSILYTVVICWYMAYAIRESLKSLSQLPLS